MSSITSVPNEILRTLPPRGACDWNINHRLLLYESNVINNIMMLLSFSFVILVYMFNILSVIYFYPKNYIFVSFFFLPIDSLIAQLYILRFHS